MKKSQQLVRKLMRLTFLSTLAVIALSNSLFAAITDAQVLQQRISITFGNDQLDNALQQLSHQLKMPLAYDGAALGIHRHTVKARSFTNREAREVLRFLLNGTGITYLVKDDNVVLVKQQAPVKVTGHVTDEKGNAIPGVSVRVRGTTTGTVTDEAGDFTLTVPGEDAVLAFSFLGYQTKETTVGKQRALTIFLTASSSSLNDVVVVGYGTQKRADLTGSVGSVKGSQLSDRPAINLEQGLAGRIAGVNVSTNSGRPGGRTRIRIRGFSSINAASDPLYIVDGIIFTSDITSINPGDIASIDVLKDASATAIYGTRGTNGVIIITTKRGNKGGRLNYDSYISVSSMARKQDVLNAAEWLYIEEESYKNAAKFDPAGFAAGKYRDPVEKRMQYLVGNTAGRAELFALDEQGIPQPLYDVDWQDAVTRKAISQGHNLSWSGGDDKSNYGLFLGYARDNGIIRNTYMQRYSVRGVVDRQVKDWLKVGGTVSYSSNKERRADESQGANNVTRQMIEMVPFIPYQYANGRYGYRGDYEGLENGDNPLAQLNESTRLYNTNTFSGNAYANIRILEDLEFVSTIGANLRNRYIPYFNSTQSDLNLGRGRNYAQISSDEARFWQWTNRVNYTHTFRQKHHLNLLAGLEYQQYNFLSWSATTQDMPDDFYEWNNLGAGSTPQSPSSSATAWQMASYFARANYNYNNKYLLTLTGRFDGSSRFGADNKYAFFPSGALAWRLSQEDFLKGSSQISNLKLRVSYGLTGNSEIGEYRSLANLGTNSYIFGGSRAAGTVISTLANPALKWEKTSQLNFGVDLGLMNDRITLEADYFVKKTKDLLLAAPVPASSGYTTMTRNIGSLRNTGLELNIQSVNIDKGNFSWRTGFNISWLKNEITALGVNNEDIYMTPDFLGRTNVLRVGESVSSFFGYITDGVWGTDEAEEAARFGKKPGDVKYRDINPDGQINSDDRTIIGKGIPDFYGTLANTLRYRNFDLTLELQYSYGNDVFKLSEHSSEDRVGRANSFATVLDAWTPGHQDTHIAQWRPAAAGYDSRLESRKVEDGSFIRGKNLMLGYTLPAKALSRIGLGGLRMYFSAQNLFIITRYSGYDPEVVTYDDAFAQGILFHDYPKARTFLFGLNVSL